jgi:hypothetical protein
MLRARRDAARDAWRSMPVMQHAAIEIIFAAPHARYYSLFSAGFTL